MLMVLAYHPTRSIAGLFILLAWLGLHALPAWAEANVTEAHLRRLQALIDQPEAQIDLLRAKLSIDQMIDPSIDIETQVARIEAMATALRQQIPLMASSRVKLDALRRFIYQAGPWNGYQAFRYDLDDPLGRIVKNKLLVTYLDTHKGNCLSMPVLFLALGERLGLNLAMATAPEHVFIKYRDEQGNSYNLETTSGAGFTRDAWLRKQLPMTDEAIDNGLYMRALSKREAIGLMADALMSHYRRLHWTDAQIKLGLWLIELNPKDAAAMISLRGAYHQEWTDEFVRKYPSPRDIPEHKQARFRELDALLATWERRVHELGWREMDYAGRMEQNE